MKHGGHLVKKRDMLRKSLSPNGGIWCVKTYKTAPSLRTDKAILGKKLIPIHLNKILYDIFIKTAELVFCGY